jgi:hypothetical protein
MSPAVIMAASVFALAVTVAPAVARVMYFLAGGSL